MFDNFKKRAKPCDMAFIKLASLMFGIFIAAIFPVLINANPLIYLALAIILMIKPAYTIFKK